MAIIIQGLTGCAICGGALDRPFTATSGCAFVKSHSLFRYCDAPLHLSCLERWPFREEFSSGYFHLCKEDAKGRPGGLLLDEGSWILVCGPSVRGSKPHYVEARLQDWPVRLYSHWERWESFLSEGYATGLEGMALEAAEGVVDHIRARLPGQGDLDRLHEYLRG